uniref:EH domain-containing protein n=1 Tax=Rhabditophanes sp. KR3021 TaxID=114890 RepID=A0AC35TRL6_9BILA
MSVHFTKVVVALIGLLAVVDCGEERSLVLVPLGQDPKSSVHKVVIPLAADGSTPSLPCVLADSGVHEHGQTFTKGAFHYRCVNGTSEVIACISKDNAVIQIGRTFIKEGTMHKCITKGNSVAYEQQNTCYQNGINYDIGDTWRNGTFQVKCQATGVAITGCYSKNESPEFLLKLGESKRQKAMKHSCLAESDGKVRYTSVMVGCERDGEIYKEGDIFSDKHIRFMCNSDGSSKVLGCWDEENKVFVELGKDVLIKEIVYRCYRSDKTTFFQRYQCKSKSFDECIKSAPNGKRKRTPIKIVFITPFFNGGLLPPSLLNEALIPKFYQEAIYCCGATTSTSNPITPQVYNMMVTSQLPRDILGDIWSLVNRTLPGQLTRQEFFSCLALIALAQKGQTISHLSTLSQLPIPYLQPYSGVSCSKINNPLRKDANKSINHGEKLGESSSRLDSEKVDDVKSVTVLLPQYMTNIKSGDGINLVINNWTSMLMKAVKIIEEANGMLTENHYASIEVVQTERGLMFVHSLAAIHKVVKRLMGSIANYCPENIQLLEYVQNFSETWANLLELQFFNEAIEKMEKVEVSGEYQKEMSHCSICARPIVSPDKPIHHSIKPYHLECLNFWSNLISQSIPIHCI